MSSSPVALRLTPPDSELLSSHIRSAQQPRRRLRVCEPWSPGRPRFAYEDEGSERVTRGAVRVAAGGCWTAELTAAVGDDRTALIHLARSGAGLADSREEAADLLLPVAEVDALLALLEGLVAQARRDGVLPP